MQFMILHVLIKDINTLPRETKQKGNQEGFLHLHQCLFVIFLFYVTSEAHF